ncbi:MAG: FtsW/RodA/SpoVE family cell cycle protein [Lachnospira sp.]|nr:FtsW/RodA/SpoVE family cell cycle protein [Lachnospira sp.]
MGRKIKKKGKRYFDYSLLFVVIFICGFGLVMIYSTSSYTAQLTYGNSEYFFFKQLQADLLGFLAMYFMYRVFDYHYFQRRWAVAIFILSIISILAIIPFGTEVNGAKRWIYLGTVSFQPSELAKFATIVMTAVGICAIGNKINKLRYVFLVWLIIGGLLGVMVYAITSNLSSAIIIFGISFVMTFVAYKGYKIYMVLIAAFTAAFAAFYTWLTNMVKSGNMTDSFRLNRFLIWLNPEKYMEDKGYQTVQALYAIGSGGLFGKGLGKSLQKLGFIPESQNDMIFSIICEELGLFGAICVILIFVLMLWRIVHIAQNAPDLLGTLIATGVFAQVAIQVILNIAVVTNTIPNTGVSLPFISYGGTSSVFLMAEIGVVLNISSQIRLEK